MFYLLLKTCTPKIEESKAPLVAVSSSSGAVRRCSRLDAADMAGVSATWSFAVSWAAAAGRVPVVDGDSGGGGW